MVDGDNKPIPSASIFLSNTSVGTTANSQGNFELYIPQGKHDLIVSSIGYETFNQTINTSDLQDFITIRLKLKAAELENITIEPYDKNGWQQWGKFFIENFIGTSAYAADCKIKNPQVLRFRNSKKNNELTVIALEPLIIENKALGYNIRFQLEVFSYKFKTNYRLYIGYPFFEPMKGNNTKQKRWEKKREEVYYGSMMHFMRSVYRNTFIQEGFEVKALQKVMNAEKQRVKEAYKRNISTTTMANGTLLIKPINQDSADYYNKILRQADYFDVVNNSLLPGDSIAYAVNSTTAGLEFQNYLLIVYKNKITPIEYQKQFPENSTAMMSQMTLINNRPIEIQANGSYYNPVDLLNSGYWGWSEKIAMMLPFDYKVKEQK